MSLLDKATPQEWDSLRKNPEYNIALDNHLDKQQSTEWGESKKVLLEHSTYQGRSINDKASEQQIAGRHYKKFKIQPAEFCHVNNIPYLEASAIKYLCRWRDKNGFEDLQKAKHFIDLLMEYENAN